MRQLGTLKADIKRYEDRAAEAREAAYDYEQRAREREAKLYPHRYRGDQ